ncbi:MAG: VIT1/CCC1 transporter family protein [Candidatus Bathyarchaeia archaeon]
MKGGSVAFNASTFRILEAAEAALSDELYASILYGRLAITHGDGPIGTKLGRMAEMERDHAEFWRDFLRRRHRPAPGRAVYGPRLALHVAASRLLGLRIFLLFLERDEREAIELYSKLIESPGIDGPERERLRGILEDELLHERELLEEESKAKEHIAHVRDAVLGMNDGLVEILSITSGLAGAYGDPFHTALGGLVVAVAGALSMGMGVFASVKAQRQVSESLLRRVEEASRYVAHVFKERLIGHMMKRGYSVELSRAVAEESSKDPELLSKIIAEEEYGLRGESMGSPRRAGLYSGLSNISGALIPLLPYFLGLPISIAMPLSVILAAAALAITGSLVAILASLPVRRRALEMILIGLGAAGSTFLIGRIASMLLGINV